MVSAMPHVALFHIPLAHAALSHHHSILPPLVIGAGIREARFCSGQGLPYSPPQPSQPPRKAGIPPAVQHISRAPHAPQPTHRLGVVV